jgi:TetR/AcrR family transcriptional repressor of nem operon
MGRTSDAKERILNSAMELIHTRSYSAVGVQEICQHAEVNKGSFYYFFESKQDLLVAALDQRLEMLNEHLLDVAFDLELSPLAQISNFLKLASQQLGTQHSDGQICGCPVGNLAAELSSCDEVVRAKIEEIMLAVTTRIAQALDSAIALGEIPRINSNHTAESIWAYLEGAILVSKIRQDASSLGRVAEKALLLIPRTKTS